MRKRDWVGGFLVLLTLVPAATPADAPPGGSIAAAEQAFLDYLDARAAAGYIESGAVQRVDARDLEAWQQEAVVQRARLDGALSAVTGSVSAGEDARAIAAMRTTLEAIDADEPDGAAAALTCADARRRDLGYVVMREALVNCFVEYGNRLRFEGRTINRGTALELLHTVDDPRRRKALFEAFVPLWTALDGHGEPDSPYRRMIALAAADAARRGSEIDAAARAIGVETAEVERWLVRVLEAWRDANPRGHMEPWDYRYANSAASRQLAPAVPPDVLAPVNARFFADLGADTATLRVLFDLAPRPDKSPLAYTDFLARGRLVDGSWRRPVARVVGTYPEGGVFSLNELVHETGHAVHVSAIHTRPAFMDWPDTLFTEAFADVPSWSVYEKDWQRRYLGSEAPVAASLRALYANVMLDVAWSLFELRLLRDPAADPNAVWTDITSRYLHIVPHPEWPWWAMRVQLAGDPGYMVNYGLGAVLTAEIRAQLVAKIGPFDAGNAAWYPWLSERLLRFGSERDTRSLMNELLGRPVSAEALLDQVRRIRAGR